MAKHWHRLATVLMLACVTPAATAQSPQAPSCEINPPSCQVPCNPPCGCKPPCQPPCAPPPPVIPALPYAAEEAGSFVAPPRTGVARGATENVGIEGASITFPELRLRLPSVQLPSLFRSRTNARMQLDAADAPWVSEGFANVHAAQNEQILMQHALALQRQIAQTAPASGQSQAEAQAAREAAEEFAAAARKELDALRCEVKRLRDLERSILEAQQRAADNPECKYPGPPPMPPPSKDSRYRTLPPQGLPPGEGFQPVMHQPPFAPGPAVPIEPVASPIRQPLSAAVVPEMQRARELAADAQRVHFEQPLPNHPAFAPMSPLAAVIRQPHLTPVAADANARPEVARARIVGVRARQ